MLKHTKIVATISDRRCEVEFIKELYDAGMNVVRINTAHQNQEGAITLISNIRKVSDKIAILLDTKGPEIRTTRCEKEIHLKKGETIKIKYDYEGIGNEECIYVNYDNFIDEVPLDALILIDDGTIELVVIKKEKDHIVCEIKTDSVLTSRKNLNVPSARLNLSSLGKRDLDFILFAINNGIDFIAHSFVRHKEDLLAIQKVLDQNNSQIKLIAKIENQEGVDNIDEILNSAYGVMVARGDLGTEISAEKIPRIQKMIVKKCVEKRKPVIVATQMLHTMIKNPKPTRAEVSDIANAIYDGTDAIMLSGETASGDYPVESVKMMTKIAKEIESHREIYGEKVSIQSDVDISTFLTKAAVIATTQLKVKLIITDTTSGKTARYLSAYRGKSPVYALCYSKSVMRELALSFGVFPDFIEKEINIQGFIKKTLKNLLEERKVKLDDLSIVLAGTYGISHGPSFIELSTVKNILHK